MKQPTVCAVCLVNGREAMVKRAIKSFRDQTYQNKRLLLWDSSPTKFLPMSYAMPGNEKTTEDIDDFTIGELRNRANDWPWTRRADIICHWDSDDWSHPRRIEEQVALLQASGKQCVGYRDMLFFREITQLIDVSTHADDPERPVYLKKDVSEAWLYSNPDQSYCIGTSLCYWRSVWEARPFPDLPKGKRGTGDGEDVVWLRGVDSLGDVSVNRTRGVNYPDEPRMIASIHLSNTQFYGSDLLEKSTSWKRAPEWDEYVRGRMAL